MRWFAAALLIGASGAALGADATRHVDFTTAIVVDGVAVVDDFKCPIAQGKRECQTPFTVGEFAYYALERQQPNQNWADAIKRDDLARAVRAAKDFPLLDDQLAMIEAAMGPMGSAGVLGAVARIIDPHAGAAK